jgi:ERCC4-type nuclease
MNFIEIIADNRELKSGVPTHLSALPGIHLEWKELAVGDYIVVGEAIFERKSASDFAASLVDQRLFSQAKRLRISLSVPHLSLKAKAINGANSACAAKLCKGL